MSVTVRYSLDYTCDPPGNCLYISVHYPVIGHSVAPHGMVAHLDAGHSWAIEAQLIQWDPVHFDQTVLGAAFATGATDATSTNTLSQPLSFDPTYIYLRWPLLQPSTEPSTHYTGYADITYDDVYEIPPPPLAGAPQLVTILG